MKRGELVLVGKHSGRHHRVGLYLEPANKLPNLMHLVYMEGRIAFVRARNLSQLICLNCGHNEAR